MKMFILIISFLLVGFTTPTTMETNNIEYSIGGDEVSTLVHQKWYCEEKGKWGSFWWKVDRTEYPDKDGWYTYYVYFYSNSYLNTHKNADGSYDKAITYIANTNLIMDEYHKGKVFNVVEVPQAYILCDWVESQGAYFYSKSPSNVINLEFESASPYNYTKKGKG